jgi:hypothetical protein
MLRISSPFWGKGMGGAGNYFVWGEFLSFCKKHFATNSLFFFLKKIVSNIKLPKFVTIAYNMKGCSGYFTFLLHIAKFC